MVFDLAFLVWVWGRCLKKIMVDNPLIRINFGSLVIELEIFAVFDIFSFTVGIHCLYCYFNLMHKISEFGYK